MLKWIMYWMQKYKNIRIITQIKSSSKQPTANTQCENCLQGHNLSVTRLYFSKHISTKGQVHAEQDFTVYLSVQTKYT